MRPPDWRLVIRVPPLVSIAIRAHRRRWLREAVASVLGQTHRNLELVIYDDAGDLADVAAGFRDDRIHYHRAVERLQASGRFAAAVAFCRGVYIGLLDDDDQYEPEFVSRLAAALDEDASAGVAFCRTTWECDGRRTAPLDARPRGPQRNAAAEMLLKGWTVSPSHMLMRRAAFEAAERDQPMPDGVAPDLFLNLRIAMAGWRHVLVDAPLVVCRWHAEQISRANRSASEVAVKTLQVVDIHDAALESLRDKRLARALLVRAVERLRTGDAALAQDDVRAAARLNAPAWPVLRRLLWFAASSGPLGELLVRCWLAWSPRGRLRRQPPRVIGDRLLPLQDNQP